MSLPAYVYVLTQAARQAFKVGWSTDPSGRALTVTPGHDPELSYQLAFADRARAQEVEAALHRLLRPHRIDGGVPGNGSREWYAADAWSDLRSLVERSAALLGYTALEPVARWVPASVWSWRESEARKAHGVQIIEEDGRSGAVAILSDLAAKPKRAR